MLPFFADKTIQRFGIFLLLLVAAAFTGCGEEGGPNFTTRIQNGNGYETTTSVVEVVPADRTVDFDPAGRPKIRFSYSLDPSSVDWTTILIYDSYTGERMRGDFTFEDNNKVAIFTRRLRETPNAIPLNSDVTYSLMVTDSVRDSTGQRVTKYFQQFKTGVGKGKGSFQVKEVQPTDSVIGSRKPLKVEFEEQIFIPSGESGRKVEACDQNKYGAIVQVTLFNPSDANHMFSVKPVEGRACLLDDDGDLCDPTDPDEICDKLEFTPNYPWGCDPVKDKNICKQSWGVGLFITVMPSLFLKGISGYPLAEPYTTQRFVIW